MSLFDRIGRSRLTAVAIGLAVILFLAVNVIAGQTLRTARVDLTENELFSVSQGTKQLLADLEEPIHMRLFLSQNLVTSAPQLAAYAGRVRSLLETYADLSGGRITLEVIDPQPFSEAEDRAVGLGINRFRIAGAEDALFFGLAATNSTDGKAEIPVFSPDREAFLEYDLTRLVAELGQPGKPVVAVFDGIGLAGNPMTGMPEQQVLVQLREFFDVRVVAGEVDELPENTRVVLAIHPQDLPERTRYTLDQWVLSGGATMVFVDPFAETQQGPRPGMPAPNPTSDLDKLFAAWGVTYDPEKAVADPASALRTVKRIEGRETEVANYPWIAVREGGMAGSDAVLSQLSTIVMTTAGALGAKDGTELTPLLTASPEAGLVKAADAGSPYGDPRKLIADMEKPEGPIVLAARVAGALKTAFPDGKPEGSAAEGEPLKSLQGTAQLIVVADADMLMDRNWIQRRQIFGQEMAQAFANNGDFVLNAVEQMAGGAALADLRGRGVSWRPFERIVELNRAAEARYLAEEQQLLQKLKDTEAKIRELSQNAPEEGELVSAESAHAIEQFRSELLATRAQLREVQYDLRRDVEQLKTWITTANVGLVPAVVAAFALGFALRRPKRRLPSKDA